MCFQRCVVYDSQLIANVLQITLTLSAVVYVFITVLSHDTKFWCGILSLYKGKNGKGIGITRRSINPNPLLKGPLSEWWWRRNNRHFYGLVNFPIKTALRYQADFGEKNQPTYLMKFIPERFYDRWAKHDFNRMASINKLTKPCVFLPALLITFWALIFNKKSRESHGM